MSSLSERALDRAAGQIGQQEKPLRSNWGHPVQDYLASVGLFHPAAWCMAFVYWCFNDAANQLAIINPLRKTGLVLGQWHNSVKYQIFSDPKPGDVFIMDLGHGLGHTGFVELVNPDGTLMTIEGNTNDTGGREGIEVERKMGTHSRKPGYPIIGFLRF